MPYTLRRRELGRRAHFRWTLILACVPVGLLLIAAIVMSAISEAAFDRFSAYSAWFVAAGVLAAAMVVFAQLQTAVDRALSRSEH